MGLQLRPSLFLYRRLTDANKYFNSFTFGFVLSIMKLAEVSASIPELENFSRRVISCFVVLFSRLHRNNFSEKYTITWSMPVDIDFNFKKDMIFVEIFFC